MTDFDLKLNQTQSSDITSHYSSYAPWCPACKQLEKTWEEYSSWAKDLNIHVAQVDVTVSPGLSGRFMVTALPTIFQ